MEGDMKTRPRLKTLMSGARVKALICGITVEPVIFMYGAVYSLGLISTQELYLHKACQVNLNYSEQICTNLTEHKDVQEETQNLVAVVQAHSGILQYLPMFVLALFAGPLSDSYGRKPFMVFAVSGLIILNVVFIINVIWFNELKVEYLLFECLQDFTGGLQILFLAANTYVVDITSVETRTARICVLGAVMNLGWMAFSPLGTKLKSSFGYLTLYSTGLCLAVATILYCIFFLKESIHHVTEERRLEIIQERENADIKCNKDVFSKMIKTVLSSFRTVTKKRPWRLNLWIFIIMALFATFVPHIPYFLFYTLQYNLDSQTYGWLNSVYSISALFSQLVLVPFLSLKVGLRDTTIIGMALVSNSIAYFLEAVSDQIWVLFLSWGVLQLLWSNIFTSTTSAISKLVDPTEIGKVLCVAEIGKSIVRLCSAPFFGYVYQASLADIPALCMYIGVLCFLIDLILAIYNYISMKRQERQKNDLREQNQMEELPM